MLLLLLLLLLLRGERRRRGGPRRRARLCGLFRDPHKEEAPSVRLDLPPARVDRPGRVPQSSAPTAARACARHAAGAALGAAGPPRATRLEGMCLSILQQENTRSLAAPSLGRLSTLARLLGCSHLWTSLSPHRAAPAHTPRLTLSSDNSGSGAARARRARRRGGAATAGAVSLLRLSARDARSAAAERASGQGACVAARDARRRRRAAERSVRGEAAGRGRGG